MATTHVQIAPGVTDFLARPLAGMGAGCGNFADQDGISHSWLFDKQI